jgi:hypothetical protein
MIVKGAAAMAASLAMSGGLAAERLARTKAVRLTALEGSFCLIFAGAQRRAHSYTADIKAVRRHAYDVRKLDERRRADQEMECGGARAEREPSSGAASGRSAE